MKPYLRIVRPDDPWIAYQREAKAAEKRDFEFARLLIFLGLAAWVAFMSWVAVSIF